MTFCYVISLAPVDAPPHGVQGAAHPISGPPDTPAATALPPFTQSTIVSPATGEVNQKANKPIVPQATFSVLIPPS